MAVAKAEILDAIANMTVLELSQLIKEMEEKFGVSAAAASCRSAGARSGGCCSSGGGADGIYRYADDRGRKQGERHQGCAGDYRAWTERSEGFGGRGAESG